MSVAIKCVDANIKELSDTGKSGNAVRGTSSPDAWRSIASQIRPIIREWKGYSQYMIVVVIVSERFQDIIDGSISRV